MPACRNTLKGVDNLISVLCYMDHRRQRCCVTINDVMSWLSAGVRCHGEVITAGGADGGVRVNVTDDVSGPVAVVSVGRFYGRRTVAIVRRLEWARPTERRRQEKVGQQQGADVGQKGRRREAGMGPEVVASVGQANNGHGPASETATRRENHSEWASRRAAGQEEMGEE